MIPNPPAALIDAAAAALTRGELIGLPTETVYGLAGAARDDRAVARIFALKGRPADHPLIVHLADAAQIDAWARAIPPAARALAAALWPGPLTLILKRAPGVSDLVTGGQDTVGLRVPAHPWAQAVLARYGDGVAAPSANRYGHLSPTTAQHVREEFGDALPLVLDGGPCEIGIESTIVDLSGPDVRVLRPGRYGADAIAAIVHAAVGEGATTASPRVSGSVSRHYAPRTPTELLARGALEAQARRAAADGECVRVLAVGNLPQQTEGLAMAADPETYARHLYAALRALDAEGADRILVETPPADAAWAAVHDRLRRATARDGAGGDDIP
jgi:L-threonylcarbamoyladenylate synthase